MNNPSIFFYIDIIWFNLDKVAKMEGGAIAAFTGKTLEQCKKLCNEYTACNSFAYNNFECHLKDKCIAASEPQKENGDFRTYYKICDQGISQFLVTALLREDSCFNLLNH